MTLSVNADDTVGCVQDAQAMAQQLEGSYQLCLQQNHSQEMDSLKDQHQQLLVAFQRLQVERDAAVADSANVTSRLCPTPESTLPENV